MWKYGCPKSPVWSGGGFEGDRSESTSISEYYEHNVDNLAMEVVGALLSMDLSYQEMRDACRWCPESPDSPHSLCSKCQEGRRRCSDA